MIPFVKYQGTGNDFILIDGRDADFSKLNVNQLCDRHFGIGADGLMILKPKLDYDFEMIYYNSDGNLSSMCGNGGRCIAHWAYSLGIKPKNHPLTFWAPDGSHTATYNDGNIHLTMNDVNNIVVLNHNIFELNTGSPHFVQFFDSGINDMEFVKFGKNIRYSETYKSVGINVNAVEIISENTIKMRTYERGVEDETLSCGTGVTAAALSYLVKQHSFDSEKNEFQEVSVSTPGGNLFVKANRIGELSFSNIELCGSAQFVFEGMI